MLVYNYELNMHLSFWSSLTTHPWPYCGLGLVKLCALYVLVLSAPVQSMPGRLIFKMTC